MFSFLLPSDTLSLLITVAISAGIAYRSSFLRNRHIMRLSLLEILYLVVVPGIIFITIYSYVQKVTSLPLSPHAFLSDRFLTNVILLTLLYTYGGAAIHTVAKALSETELRHNNSEAARTNKYFHLSFSHNLAYGGAILTIGFLTLLEINHVSNYGYDQFFPPLLRGLAIVIAFLISFYFYTHSDDDYGGRWLDLTVTFICAWFAVGIIVYATVKTGTSLFSYQLLLPSLLGFGIISLLHLTLVFRYLRREKLLSPNAFFRKVSPMILRRSK